MGLSQKGNMCVFQLKKLGAIWTVCQKVKKKELRNVLEF